MFKLELNNCDVSYDLQFRLKSIRGLDQLEAMYMNTCKAVIGCRC